MVPVLAECERPAVLGRLLNWSGLSLAVGCSVLLVLLAYPVSQSAHLAIVAAPPPALSQQAVRASVTLPPAAGRIPRASLTLPAANRFVNVKADRGGMDSITGVGHFLGVACLLVVGTALLAIAQLRRRETTPLMGVRSWVACAYEAEIGRCQIIVRNLPPSATWQSLKEHFSEAGEVVFSKVFLEGATPSYGVVRFSRPEEVERALMVMVNYTMDGNSLEITADASSEVARSADLDRPHHRRSTYPRSPRHFAEWRRDPKDTTELDGEEVERIEQSLAERDELRAKRLFTASDKIRGSLRSRGITVEDGDRTWTADPRALEVPRLLSNTTGKYVRDANDVSDGSAEDKELVVEVERLLLKRHQLRAVGNFEQADAIRDKLRSSGVVIDDQARTWSSQSDSPVREDTNHPYMRHPNDVSDGSAEDKELVAEVERLITERMRLREAGRFAEADAIRDKLRTTGVVIDDYSRTWSSQSRDSGSFRVFNLPTTTSWETLKDHFKVVNDIVHIHINTDPETRLPTRAVVRFPSSELALKAMTTLANVQYQGVILQMKPFRKAARAPYTPR